MGLLGYFVRSTVTAFKEGSEQAESESHYKILQENWNGIIDDFRQGTGIDAIARRFHASHQIPETRTILFLGSFIRSLAKADDPGGRETALQLAALQTCDADEQDAASFIRSLSYRDTVFACTSCFGYPAKYQYEKTEGVIILSKAYLYFFEISGRNLARKNTSGIAELGGEVTVDAIGSVIPLVDLLDAGWDIASNTAEGFRDFFDKDRIRILQTLFEKQLALAIPLSSLQALGPHTDKKQVTYFKVTYQQDQEAAQLFLKPADAGTDINQWIQGWNDLIADVAVGEGIVFAKQS
jgi:hypothetical protein